MINVSEFVTIEMSKPGNNVVIRVDAKALGLDAHKTAQAINAAGHFPSSTRTYPRQYVDIDVHPRANTEDQRQDIVKICQKLLES